MNCQICGKKIGEYQCSVCGRIVCGDHVVSADGKIYCTDHSPQKSQLKNEETAPNTENKLLGTIRNVILMLAILLIGLVAIYYIFLSSLEELFGQSGMQGIAASFQSAATLIMTGIGIIIFILVIVYFIFKKSNK